MCVVGSTSPLAARTDFGLFTLCNGQLRYFTKTSDMCILSLSL